MGMGRLLECLRGMTRGMSSAGGVLHTEEEEACELLSGRRARGADSRKEHYALLL